MLVVFGIVKNEADKIGDFVKGALQIADAVYLNDTGSTDDTVRLATEAGAVVVPTKWIDFGANLTKVVNQAQLMCGLGPEDWLLRLDADMSIEELHPGFLTWLKAGATADAYNVPVREGCSEWRLPLLMRAGQEWKYIGPTHEYLDATGRSCEDMVGIAIRHHATGSNRKHKHLRDILLLLEGVADNDPRSTFYSADAHLCLGNWVEALTLFARRASMANTWEEERWFAEYRAGQCMLHLDPEMGVKFLMAAWMKRPDRSEPLMRIIEFCEEKRIQELPGPSSLFVETSAYV